MHHNSWLARQGHLSSSTEAVKVFTLFHEKKNNNECLGEKVNYRLYFFTKVSGGK